MAARSTVFTSFTDFWERLLAYPPLGTVERQCGLGYLTWRGRGYFFSSFFSSLFSCAFSCALSLFCVANFTDSVSCFAVVILLCDCVAN